MGSTEVGSTEVGSTEVGSTEVGSTDASATEEPAAMLTREGAVAIITLNRPGSMNAVNRAMSSVVGMAIEELANDPKLKVGVIIGTGRAFCAGMDLKAFAAGEDVSAHGHPEWGFAGLTRHFIDKPLIAAVNGAAIGGGFEIVMACDLAVAASDATFALPEVKRGLYAAGGGALRLPRQIPRRIAMELMLTGVTITAERALELGLINRVVSQSELPEAALALAKTIAENAPLAVQATKRLAYESLAHGSDWGNEIWDLNAKTEHVLMNSDDAHEGAIAFAERRSPVWRGC